MGARRALEIRSSGWPRCCTAPPPRNCGTSPTPRSTTSHAAPAGRRPQPTPLDPWTWTALQRCLDHRKTLGSNNSHVLITMQTKATRAASVRQLRQEHPARGRHPTPHPALHPAGRPRRHRRRETRRQHLRHDQRGRPLLGAAGGERRGTAALIRNQGDGRFHLTPPSVTDLFPRRCINRYASEGVGAREMLLFFTLLGCGRAGNERVESAGGVCWPGFEEAAVALGVHSEVGNSARCSSTGRGWSTRGSRRRTPRSCCSTT